MGLVGTIRACFTVRILHAKQQAKTFLPGHIYASASPERSLVLCNRQAPLGRAPHAILANNTMNSSQPRTTSDDSARPPWMGTTKHAPSKPRSGDLVPTQSPKFRINNAAVSSQVKVDGHRGVSIFRPKRISEVYTPESSSSQRQSLKPLHTKPLPSPYHHSKTTTHVGFSPSERRSGQREGKAAHSRCAWREVFTSCFSPVARQKLRQFVLPCASATAATQRGVLKSGWLTSEKQLFTALETGRCTLLKNWKTRLVSLLVISIIRRRPKPPPPPPRPPPTKKTHTPQGDPS